MNFFIPVPEVENVPSICSWMDGFFQKGFRWRQK